MDINSYVSVYGDIRRRDISSLLPAQVRCSHTLHLSLLLTQSSQWESSLSFWRQHHEASALLPHHLSDNTLRGVYVSVCPPPFQ